MAIYPSPTTGPSNRVFRAMIIAGLEPAPPPAGVSSAGGLHHICCGIGDPGVSVVPQTLHTIDLGVSA